MMTMTVVVFVLCYALIALEHFIKINKSATALVAAGLMWTLYSLASPLGVAEVNEQLTAKLAETAAIVFFLISAMTIVEVIDAHDGFEIIISRIKTSRLSTLLWIIGFTSFYLSAILDNMTTTIVMVTMMKRFLRDHRHRLFFAGIIVIAANAGGAWTPIGDVTTTMLWISGQITTGNIMKSLWIPSMINTLLALLMGSLVLRGNIVAPEKVKNNNTSRFEKGLMLFMGMGCLILVPIFKAATNLPPYLGILFALGILWLTGNILHRHKSDEERDRLRLARALERIDMASAMFFIGILLAVATLSANGMLPVFARWLETKIGDQSLIVMLIGLSSAIFDNIPLVASAMGMYPLTQFPADSFIWEFLAYCAGTGGSILIIGSAAGVAAMGLEKIEFFWYARRIGPIALLGYLGGAAAYLVQYRLLH